MRSSRLAGPAGTVRALLLALGCVLALAMALPAHAADAPTTAADPVLEKQLIEIASELRCLVCQNQTIADSHAELAVDLRNQVREMLRQGQSRKQIIEYMTARYGDFVLYRPPLNQGTAVLWFGPALLLAGGLLVLGVVLRRRTRLSADQFEPDEEEIAAASPAPIRSTPR